MQETAPLPLSPSRVSDFKACPQLFKYRAVDRLPEPEDPHLSIGRAVHSALEGLFRLHPGERTLPRAVALLAEVWEEARGLEQNPLPFDPEGEAALRSRAGELVRNYFDLEDPSRVEPHEIEWWVEHAEERVTLRGIIDRVEVLADGSWVLTDYKTGSSPSERASFGSFFGLRFYALVCWRAFGKMPAELRLLHLKKPEVIRLTPTASMLRGLERQLDAVGLAIRRAYRTGDWRPRPGFLCSWCPHRGICPSWQSAAS